MKNWHSFLYQGLNLDEGIMSLEAAGLLIATKNATEIATQNTNMISELLAGTHIL